MRRHGIENSHSRCLSGLFQAEHHDAPQMQAWGSERKRPCCYPVIGMTVHFEVGKRFDKGFGEGKPVRYVYHLSFEEMPTPDIWRTFRFKRARDGRGCPLLAPNAAR
jgi:hypothetical protein